MRGVEKREGIYAGEFVRDSLLTIAYRYDLVILYPRC